MACWSSTAACVVKSLRRSGLKPGESVLVIGLGIMGMMHVNLARQLGAGIVIGADCSSAGHIGRASWARILAWWYRARISWIRCGR